MNLRLSLCLIAITLVTIDANGEPRSLQDIKSRFYSLNSGASASAAAFGRGSRAASRATVNTGYRPQAQYRPYGASRSPRVDVEDEFAEYPPEFHQPARRLSPPASNKYAPGLVAQSAAAVSGNGAAGATASATSADAARPTRRHSPRPQFGSRREFNEFEATNGRRRPVGNRVHAVAASSAETGEDPATRFAPARFRPNFDTRPRHVPGYEFEDEAESNYSPYRRTRYEPRRPRVPSVPAHVYSQPAASEGVGVAMAAAGAASPRGTTASVAFAGRTPSGTRGHGGYRSSPQSYNEHDVDEEEYNEHHEGPNTVNEYAAAAGTHSLDDHGVETSSYLRETENEENEQHGEEDSDQFYQAGSYGKNSEEKHNENYQNADEDIVHQPNLFHKRSSNTKYSNNVEKKRSETGSSVKARDAYHTSFDNKGRKFKERVDQKSHKEGAGVVQSENSSQSTEADENDERRFDSRNLGDFVGVDGKVHAQRPSLNLPTASSAAAASATASSNGVSSSATGVTN